MVIVNKLIVLREVRGNSVPYSGCADANIGEVHYFDYVRKWKTFNLPTELDTVVP